MLSLQAVNFVLSFAFDTPHATMAGIDAANVFYMVYIGFSVSQHIFQLDLL